MKQAMLQSARNIIYREVPVPDIKENQVLLKVSRIGVCGSDIHAYNDRHPFIQLPVVQGHELAAIVEKTGASVKNCSPGERVTIMPQVFCGKCYACCAGHYNVCKTLEVIGCQAEGCAQEYFVVDADMVVPLPAALSLDEGAMIEPAAVGYHAASLGGDLRGKKVLVLGAGTIGNLTAQCAAALGADAVMISDLCDFRLQKALDTGISYAVNPGKENLSEKISACTGGDGPDVVYECVGSETTIGQAIKYVKKRGIIVVVGVYGQPEIAVNFALVQDRELTLQGALMYTAKDYAGVIGLIENRKVNVSSLITEKFDFAHYNDAYVYIEKNKDQCLKVLIDMDKI